MVEAVSEGTVDNTATVSGSDIDTDPANDSSTVTVTIQAGNGPLPGFEFRGGGCGLSATSPKSSVFPLALSLAGLAGAFLATRSISKR